MPSVPKIGMRLIKTAVAVFLCFLVDFFRDGGTPFYSAIAAILCMQPELGSSLKVGKERIIATIIGGIVGMAMLAFETTARERLARFKVGCSASVAAGVLIHPGTVDLMLAIPERLDIQAGFLELGDDWIFPGPRHINLFAPR